MRVTARVPGPDGRARRRRGDEPRREHARATVLGDETEILRGELPAGHARRGPGGAARCPRRRSRCPTAGAARSTTTGRWCSIDAVELQVATGALRAACEEMGAVLVRAAHSANIKERRDCSTALFDPQGQMVMQAEHIPVHLGAMPAAVAAVLDEDHEPGRLVDPQRPVRRRHAPARHHGRHAGVRAADGGALLGFAASRAHHADVGGRVPGSMPADSTTLEEEGVVIAPQPLDAAARRRARRADAPARSSAAPTCARSSPPTRPARGGWPSSPRGIGPERLAEATAAVLDYAERRTRARARARWTTACARRPTCSRRAEGDLELRLRAEVRGDELVLDFTGSARAARAATSTARSRSRASACLFALRVLTDPDIPASAGAERPLTRHRARGLAAQRARPRRGRRRQRRDVLARRRPRAARVRPRARPGHDEQPHARQRRVHLLRDARRRPGRVPGRRRAERRARRDEQHAQHAGRGARARVPAARRRVRAAARVGRRRARTAAATASSARSRRSSDDDLLAHHRAPAPRAAGRRRRRATARAGRNLLDGEELGPKATGDAARRASGCGSRPPAAGATARPLGSTVTLDAPGPGREQARRSSSRLLDRLLVDPERVARRRGARSTSRRP